MFSGLFVLPKVGRALLLLILMSLLWGPNEPGLFVLGDQLWGTKCPGTEWVRDQMRSSRGLELSAGYGDEGCGKECCVHRGSH